MGKVIHMRYILCIFSLYIFSYSQNTADINKLKKLFPKSIGEFISDDKGNSGAVTQAGFSFSFVEMNYKNNRTQKLSLKVMDYTTAKPMFQAVTQVWNNQFQINTNEQSIGPYIYKDFKGWKTINHIEKQVQLIISAHGRYLIYLELFNTDDIDQANQIIKTLNIDVLKV